MSKKLLVLVILLLGCMWLYTLPALSLSSNDRVWSMYFHEEMHTSTYITIPPRGDANSDGKVSISDVIYLINYLFKGGPDITHETEEERLYKGDVNVDGSITISDVVYLINFLYKGGCDPGTPCYDTVTKTCYAPPCNP